MKWILPAAYVCALAWLLWVARRNKSLYAYAKAVCSGLFLVAAFGTGPSVGHSAQIGYVMLLVALVLCAFGDVFLGVANRNANKVSKKPFLAGAASFSLAHLVFCILFYQFDIFRITDIILPCLLLLLLLMLEKTKQIRLKKMRPVAYIYTMLVGLMAGKAVTLLAMMENPSAGPWLLAVGAALFLISDMILLFLYFGVRRRRFFRGANLLTYYIGVFLMAISFGYM